MASSAASRAAAVGFWSAAAAGVEDSTRGGLSGHGAKRIETAFVPGSVQVPRVPCPPEYAPDARNRGIGGRRRVPFAEAVADGFELGDFESVPRIPLPLGVEAGGKACSPLQVRPDGWPGGRSKAEVVDL